MSRTSNKTREIYHQTQSKHSNAVREELFSSGTELRKRTTGTADDVDSVLKHHHEMQEKVALEMVTLAQNLKDNCTIASQVIKKDVEVSRPLDMTLFVIL